MIPEDRTVSQWLADPPALSAIYGDETLARERAERLRAVLTAWRERFGDGPVRVFRAPGRINLRGMHVDTHGGWLNLMTHQREVLVVAGRSPDGVNRIANTSPDFPAIEFRAGDLPERGEQPWAAFIVSPAVRKRVAATPGHWRNYVEGAFLRAGASGQHAPALQMLVDSNLPRGAALSSSAALCIALLEAWWGWMGHRPDVDERILAAQDAEWYTGSRCGTCDQAAIVLGQPGGVIHGALHPGEFTTAGARAIAFPEALRVLVINSFTERSISGAAKVAYTRNRFAYSMAMRILGQALAAAGHDPSVVRACRYLSGIRPEVLGGLAPLYGILRDIPESLTVQDLRGRYDLPEFDQEFARYFGDLPAESRPQTFDLRGPLLFGIAESERARHFASALESGDFARAGHLMTVGHEGDRVSRQGEPSLHPGAAEIGDERVPVVEMPGAYGASSPALDFIVDTALDAGALGASLTGAGIAGVVLALCRKEEADHVAHSVWSAMSGESYRKIAGLTSCLVPEDRVDGIVLNFATAGAGEIGSFHPAG